MVLDPPPRDNGRDLERWTVVGLLDHIIQVHNEMPDRAFAFILGAGASKSSGVPTGSELVQRWLGELHRQRDSDRLPLSAWATSDNLGIRGFDLERAPEFYPQVFEARFGSDAEQGFAALEYAMKDAEPGVGYSVLATVLATTRHRVVITPNFDNLVADALATFAHTHPLMVGHESLAHFARPSLRRPLVAKVHRDLFFEPRNTPAELLELPDTWVSPLRALFEHYTPLVIGYGGNDGSLMGLLRTIEPRRIVGRMLWCYREEDGLPRQEILEVVRRHSGVLVPILGFDETMLLLGDRLKYPLLADVIEKRANERCRQYLGRIEDVRVRLSLPLGDPVADAARRQVGQALAMTMQRDWELKVEQEADAEKRGEAYRAGVAKFPRSTSLFNNGALFF
jgi:hypothetical protein